MKTINVVGAMLLVAAPAFAHVGVAPRESKLGATETYTLRVPSEGTAGSRAPAPVTKLVPAGGQ